VLQPFLSGQDSALPALKALADYPGFLDAQIRLQRVTQLLENTVGVPREQLEDTNLLPGDAVVREFIGGSTVKLPHND
jgi:hypothetical protein